MTYAIIFILLLALELVYFKIADKYNIIDKPNLRSSHKSITLRGGGIVFLLSLWLYAAFFGFQYPWVLAAVTLVGGISFVDDIRSLPDSTRLVAQFLSMFMVFYQFGILSLSNWWIVLIALIVCVGIINAYNFMDGINGITGAYSLAVVLPLIWLNCKFDFISMPYLYVTVLGILVFLIFNFRKRAKCFAGDVGSISMAMILIFALGSLILKTKDFSYLILIGLYGADAVLTIVHRIQLHESLGQAHRKHAYQIMANELKIPHVAVSSSYMLIQLAISAGLIFLPVNHYLYMFVVIVVLALCYVLFMKKYYHLHQAYLDSKI